MPSILKYFKKFIKQNLAFLNLPARLLEKMSFLIMFCVSQCFFFQNQICG